MTILPQVRAVPTALALVALLAGACKLDRSSPADAPAGIAFFRGPDRMLMVEAPRPPPVSLRRPSAVVLSRS